METDPNVLLAAAVREREDYNGAHQRACLEIERLRGTFAKVFDLLVIARNSKDEEALQEAIDVVAVASCRDDNF